MLDNLDTLHSSKLIPTLRLAICADDEETTKDIVAILISSKQLRTLLLESVFPGLGIDICCLASEKGSAKCLSYFIQLGSKVNNRACNDQTALMLAATGGHTECVHHLLRAGAKINAKDRRGRSALMLAAESGRTMCVVQLLQEGAKVNDTSDNGCTALMLACQYGHVESVRKLLEYGASVNRSDNQRKTPLMYASEFGHVQCLQELFGASVHMNATDGTDWNAAFYAVAARNQECLLHLLRNNINLHHTISHNRKSVLHICAESGDIRALTLLVRCGVDIHMRTKSGLTALMISAGRGLPDCVRYLLQNGAEANATDGDGKTALIHAARGGRSQCVGILLQAGSELNAKDNTGTTALISAVDRSLDYLRTRSEHLHCVDLLLATGADVTFANNDLDSALSLAFIKDNPEQFSRRIGVFLKHAHQTPFILQFTLEKLASLSRNDFYFLYQIMLQSSIIPQGNITPFRNTFHNTNVPILAQAVLSNDVGLAKFLLVNLVFTWSQVKAVQQVLPDGETTVCRELKTLITTMGSNPWPLGVLAFTQVSSLILSSPLDRRSSVEQTGLPARLQRMLLFKEDVSRLCHQTWEDIPLSPTSWGMLPCESPLLYNWPCGLRFQPCHCGHCPNSGVVVVDADREV